MKVIIVGLRQTGKTTLLHKILRMHPNNTFSFILDGFELLPAGPARANLPDLPNMIITAQTIEEIPPHILANALILKTPDIRV